jgi:hypothetical protein
MHQLWGYKVEEKLYVGGTRTKKVEYHCSRLTMNWLQVWRGRSLKLLCLCCLLSQQFVVPLLRMVMASLDDSRHCLVYICLAFASHLYDC